MAQFLRPDSDIAQGEWVDQDSNVVDLYQTIDEVVRDDDDYIQITLGDDTATLAERTYHIDLSSASTPVSGTRTLRVAGGAGFTGRNADTDWELYEGTTLVQSGTIMAGVTSTTIVEYSITITGTITDYSDLELKLIGVYVEKRTHIIITRVEFEIPDSSLPPTVTTQAVTNILATFATGNGNVTSDGGATITERGVCWSTSPNPTTADSTATSAGTTGAYTASIINLTGATTYYVRAYAINSEGTSYGGEVEFKTKKPQRFFFIT